MIDSMQYIKKVSMPKIEVVRRTIKGRKKSLKMERKKCGKRGKTSGRTMITTKNCL